MMQLMPLDLPAPVAPAMSRWGVVARLRNTGPAGDVLADGDVERVGGLARPRATAGCRPAPPAGGVWLGTSTPMAERPGMGARMRTSVAAIA